MQDECLWRILRIITQQKQANKLTNSEAGGAFSQPEYRNSTPTQTSLWNLSPYNRSSPNTELPSVPFQKVQGSQLSEHSSKAIAGHGGLVLVGALKENCMTS